MTRTLFFALLIYNLLLCSLQGSELLKVTRADSKDMVQLYFRFDTPPEFTTIENGRRIDLVFAQSISNPGFTIFEPDDNIVKILPRTADKDFVVSLFFRYRPQRYTMVRSEDNALVFEVLLGNEFSKSYRELAERLNGLSLVDETVEDYSNPYLRSPYKNDWMSFFSKYEFPVEIKLPVTFSSPPFPLIRLLPQIGERYRELLDASVLELATENRWNQVSARISQDIRQTPDEESVKLLALCYSEALARNGDVTGSIGQLHQLQNSYRGELLGTYAGYLLSNLHAVHGDPHLASYGYKVLDKSIDNRNPLAPYLLLSRIETALATANYPEMNILLQNDDVGIPAEIADIMRIRQADYWYAIKQYTKAFAAYRLEAGTDELDRLPYSLGGYCDTLYIQKNFKQAAQCYERLGSLISGKEQLSMVLYRKNMAALKFLEDRRALEDAFLHIENSYNGTEAGYRAALKRNDLLLLNDKSYATEAIKEYDRISSESSLRSIREEALFKAALLHSQKGDHGLAITLLHRLLREFQVGNVRMSAQALLIDILPTEIKRLVEHKEYIQALVLAKQNRELFRKNWLSSRFLVDIAEAYQKIGIFDEAQKLYLYLIEISGAAQKENYFLPMIQATFNHGNYSLADDYASQYVYNYPNGRFHDEILVIRLQSLMADERLPEARRLLPDPVPEQPDFLALAAALFFRTDEHLRCLAALEQLEKLHVSFNGRQQFMYGESLYRTGNWDGARGALLEVTDDNLFYDQALYRLAELARKEGDDKKALSFLQQIVEKGHRSTWKEFAKRELQFMEETKRL